MSTWEDVKERAGELRRDMEFDNHRRSRLIDKTAGVGNSDLGIIAMFGDREDVRDAYHAVFGTP